MLINCLFISIQIHVITCNKVKKIGPCIHEYYVCNMQQNNILYFWLTVCGLVCIPTVILVENLNIWFHRDLFSLIFKSTFQELLIIFPLFAHKWKSKHYILTQL
jgi:hypothetical protein